MLISWFAKLIVALNSNKRSAEIAAGVACGFLLGLMPAGNLLWIFLFAVTFFLKINLGVELIAIAVAKLAAPLLDRLLHLLGYAVLTLEPFYGFFTALYNTPVLPYSRFQNTVVMGALIAGVLLWYPVFRLSSWLIARYRVQVRDRLSENRVVKRFFGLPVIWNLSQAVRRVEKTYRLMM